MNFKQLQYCSAIILSFKAQFLFLSLFFASMNVFGQIVDCPNNNNDEPSYAAPGEQIVNGLPVYLLIDVNGVNSANNDFCIGNSGNEDTDSGCGTFIFTNLDGGQDGCGAQFCFSPRQGCGSALGNTCIFQEDPNNPGTWENLGSLDAANFTDLCIVAPPGVDQYAITICRPGNGPVSVVDVEIIEPPTIELTPANSVCTADLPSSINLLTFEPVSQTGGVWSSPEGGIVTSAEIPVDAIAGDTYTYSYCYDTSVDQGYQCIICDDLTFTVTDDCCQPIVCDDNDCNTEDVFDLALCECIFTPIEAPSCDDQDCTTIDSYDAAICNCVNTPIATPTCIYSQDTQVVEGCSIADIPAPFATAEEVLENLPTDCELIFEVNDFSTGELCSAVVPLQLTRIYTLANDANGNGTIDDGEILQECEQVFVVIDTTAPTFEVTPADITIACLDDTEPSVLPIALDACDEAPVVLYLDVIMLPTCIESYTIERTWTATDACGNELEHVQIITVEACEPPTCDDNDCTTTDSFDAAICNCVNTPIATPTCIYSQDTQVVEGCSIADIPAPFATAEEVLENLPTDCELIFEVNDFSTGELCSAAVPLQLTRIYTLANDANGNGTIDDGEILQECEQVFVVVDSTDPFFTNAPADITVVCGDEPDSFNPIVDDCDPNVMIVFDEVVNEPACIESYTIERTWTATDVCGNESIHQQIITVETCEPPVCDDGNCATIDTFDEAVCDCVYTPVPTPNCIDPQLETEILEGCGVEVVPAAETDISIIFADLPVGCDLLFGNNDFTSSTICNEVVPLSLTRVYYVGIDGDGDGVISEDEILHTCQESYIIYDTTGPELSATPADLVIACDEVEEFPPMTVTALDECGESTVGFIEEFTGGGCLGGYDIIRTWTATDACGNETVHTQTITVETCEAPSCDDNDCNTADVYNTVTCECENNPIEPGSCDDEDCNTDDVYNTETCECENTPITPPSCDDGNCLTVDTYDPATCGCVYTALPTPSCIDPQLETEILEGCGIEVVPAAETDISIIFADLPVGCDLLFGNNDFASSTICNEVVPLSLTRIYYVGIDGNGDGVISEDEILHTCQESYIIYDTTGPELSATPADLVIACDEVEEFPPMTVTASDECSETTVGFIEEFTGGGCLGGYDIIRTWTATDACGNETVHTQTITVETCEAPSCDDNDCNTADVYNTVTCECENNPIEPGSCDDEDCNTDDVYNTETCECENTPITPPSCDDGNCLTVDTYDPATCGCVYTPVPTPSCIDPQLETEILEGCGIEVVPAAETDISIIFADLPVGCDLLFGNNDFASSTICNEVVPLSLTRIYYVGIDGNGDGVISEDEILHTCQESYIIYDTTGPVLSATPADLVIACDEVEEFPPMTVTASDECSESTVGFIEEFTGGGCLGGYDIIRTWTATDACGNETVHTQTITVETCEAPSCDDNDCNTADVYNTVTCECENNPIEPGSCDDMDCTTEDVYNTETCECENTPITPPNCDDEDCTTEDVYNTMTCECEHTPITPPSCDDEDCTTEDVYNTTICECEYTPITPPNCDDEDCTTEDVYNTETCECENTPITPPSCDDEDCNTADVYNTVTCECENNPIEPGSCDDEDCTTEDVYNTETCECENTPITPPSCDDEDCTTEDVYNTTTCECEYTPITPPSCDDNDCTTEDTYDVEECVCVNKPIETPNCDDNDCNTADVYNTMTCECENNPIEPGSCDDMDCTTEDVYNTVTCECENTPITPPSCDDNDCTTIDSYDSSNCTCVNEPIDIPSCDDQDECTEDLFDTASCECVNAPIANCGECDPLKIVVEEIVEPSCYGDSDGAIDIDVPCFGGGGNVEVINLAVNRSATQSSTWNGAVAGLAVDGNTNGGWYQANSVSGTNWSVQPWWQVDLGSIHSIDYIEIWGRTDCCQDFLSDYYVFVSDNPFPAGNVTTLLNTSGVSNYYFAGPGATPESTDVFSTGRYVRVMLNGNHLLQLAEVKVFGKSVVGSGGCNFTYDWSDGLPSTQDQSGLAVGTYSVTVTNEDTGCDESLEITIEDSAPMTCYMVEKSPISEYGGSNGVLGAWVDGGTGPFEFNWNNGGDEAILYNLSAGDYQVTITDANGCTCETDHVLTEPEPTIGGGNCENPTNLALNQPATQSSTQIGAEASRGNDGNTDGNFWSTNSVTLTNWTHQPWWEVELQDNCNIDEIYIYNRTDGNEDHFSNFWVLISDSPNPSYGDPGVTAFEHTGIAGTPTIIQVNGTGKYVRIQLQGTAFLAIAEVEVYGCCEGGPSGPTCTEGAYCDDLDACTTDDVYDVDCNCAGTFADEDGDGVCDVEDECPGYDDTLDVNENGTPDGCENNNECTVGASCDDMDNCTTNDVYDEDCNCLGEFADEDQDGVCDAEDQCPGYDDLLDVNENGIADDCETSTGPSETCDVTIQVIGNSIVIDNVNNPINYIKVYDMDGGLVGICNNDCDLTEIYSNLPDGEYLVDIETFSSSWSAICNIEEVIVVGDTEGYCESYGLTIDYEWIDKIQLGTNLNVSGNDNGYGDYTSTIVHSTAGSNVSIELSPGYSSSPVLQYWAVYVDWNNDFDFNDLNEDAATVSGIGSVSTSISVPSNTVNGHHRVRIVMSPVDDLLPCGSINYGEVEDYTINIKGALPLIDEDSEFANPIFLGKQTTGDFTAYPNPATDELFLNLKEFEGLDVTIDISNIFGETKFSYQTDDLDQEIIKIDLNDFRNGMFTVSINSSKRKRQSKQFVIAKTY